MLIEFDLKSLETLPYLISNCPKKCIYGLINESDKRIQVYKTTNFLYHISRIFNEINNLDNRKLKQDIQKIKLVFLETNFVSDLQMNIKYRYQYDKYKNLGYSFYKDYNPVNYRIKESYRSKNGKVYYIVELVNTRKDKILVGAFSKVIDAKKFISDNYGNGVVDIIICDNDITKSFRSSK